jgi:multidrug efflux pump subunit AcrB
LRFAVRYRYVTVAAVTAALLISSALVAGGRIPFVFVQKMDSETLLVDVDMPVGTPVERTKEAIAVIEDACLQTPEVETTWAIMGAQIDADEHGTYATLRSHLGQVIVELKTVEQRDRSSDEVIAQLREQTAAIPGINSLRYRAMQGGPAGREIEIEVTGQRMDDILSATETLKNKLAHYAGVYDLTDDYEEGQPELQIELLDSARSLGLTTRSLATEIRGAFYGLEARTLQREREDVDIRVRFPQNRRKHVYELESMRVTTPTGVSVPFCEVARLVETRGTAAIHRIDQRRAVVVSADVDQKQSNSETIIADLRPAVAELEREFPGLRARFTGNKRETTRSLVSLRRDFLIALVIIYFMLAGLFKSYVQPLVVLTAVPFGLNGVIVGHWVMGYPLTILSMIGVVALTGIVVNDGLILVNFVNKEREAGKPVTEAVISAGLRRLRPILLTSLTTILGLAPLMLETSFQARFLIPMAISISFGLLFATVLTLLVVPANYMIVHDLKALVRRIWLGPQPYPSDTPAA